MDNPETGSPRGASDDATHSAAAQSAMWRMAAHEDGPPLGAFGANASHVGGNRATNISREWKTFNAVPLTANDDLATAPIDVVQLKAGDLACP
ncbi:MAG TPA: hypothetical protein VFG00_03420 [Acidothermaceae bacterium]|nr:hypothetical protein [Acidothermaceae bacterium]